MNIVMQKSIKRKMAMTKNKPTKPSIPILRYHTPWRINNGQSGNMTIVITSAKAPIAYACFFHCGPSYNHM